jgi:hypothetical protein
VPIDPVAESAGATQQVPGTLWLVSTGSNEIVWNQADVSAPVKLFWFICGLPPTGTINLISCTIQGASGHAAVPATMPKLSLFRHVVGGSPALVTSITDTAATVGAYHAARALVLNAPTFAGEEIQPNCRYFFCLEGEAGANSAVGLKILSSYVGITRAS